MAHGDGEWDGDRDWEKDDDEVAGPNSFSFIPKLTTDSKLGPVDFSGDEFPKSEIGNDLTRLDGESAAKLAQYERAFAPRNAFRMSTGGLGFGLQSFNRAGWGNPTWTYYAGLDPERDEDSPRSYKEAPTPLRAGYKDMAAPTVDYYTNMLYRPLYDFTVRGGGWMPENPFDVLGGETLFPERAPFKPQKIK